MPDESPPSVEDAGGTEHVVSRGPQSPIQRSYAHVVATGRPGDLDTHEDEPIWGTDDVDRQDRFDELNLFPAFPPLVFERRAEPWNSRFGHASDHLGVAPPDDPEASSPAVTGPAVEQMGASEGVDEPHVESSSLGRIYTLDELLREGRPTRTFDLPVGDSGQTVRRTASFRNLTSATVAPSAIRLSINPLTDSGTVWEGGADSSRRLNRAERPSSRAEGSWAQTVLSRSGGDTASDSGRRDHEPSAGVPQRRRRRLAMRQGLSLGEWTANEPDDMTLPSDGDLEADNDEDEDWPNFFTTTRPPSFYTHPNITGDIDMDAWGQTSTTGGSTLRRGGNNRRRPSSLPHADAAAELALIHDRARRRREDNELQLLQRSAQIRSGTTPTNIQLQRTSEPIIVSANRRRRRSNDASPVAERSSTRANLKRKLSDERVVKRPRLDLARSIDELPFIFESSQPSYLRYSTAFDTTLELPSDFPQPSRNSHLVLTYETAPRSTPRPKLTFTAHPMPAGDDSDASSLRTIHPIPVECGIYYYEIEVSDRGQYGYMTFGLSQGNVPLGRLIGWDPGSYGWHADDGRSFAGQGSGELFSDKWTTGDVVGCGVDFPSGRAFFTKNGEFMGWRFSGLGQGLFPAIGLRSVSESVIVNFTGPFTFDIDDFVRGRRNTVFEPLVKLGPMPEVVPRLVDQVIVSKSVAIDVCVEASSEEVEGIDSASKVELPTASVRSAGDRATAAFVLDFLDHNGYTDTLASVVDTMRQRKWNSSRGAIHGPQLARRTSSADARFIRFLQKLSMNQGFLVKSGLTIETLEHDTRYEPAEVAMIRGGQFHRVLVHDLVRRLIWHPSAVDAGSSSAEASTADADAEEEAVIFGRSLLAASKSTRWSDEDTALLKEAFGLLGLDFFPQKLRDLWSERRLRDYERLLIHLRASAGLRSKSQLEHAFGQMMVVSKALAARGEGEAAFVDIRRILPSVVEAEAKSQDNKT